MAVFGCIADDFTGASDAASFLVKGGMSVRLYNGIPERPEERGQRPGHCHCFKIQDTGNSTGSG